MNLTTSLQSFKRSWIHHTGLQILTLTVLAGTFTFLACVISVSMSLGRIMSRWGDSVQMTAFLKEEVKPDKLKSLEEALRSMPEFETIKYISKQDARQDFSTQLANYAPDLLKDSGFDSAFPASFQMKLKTSEYVRELPALAKKVSSYEAVEDISYGQDWVENYSGFVQGISQFGKAIGILLFFASLFIIGNSIRLSISQRIEEIEIQELVGCTPWMIRAPFLFEGALLGLLSSAIAVISGFGVHQLEVKYLASHLSLLGLASQLEYLGGGGIALFLLVGTLAGMLGSYICLRGLNDGWSARRRAES